MAKGKTKSKGKPQIMPPAREPSGKIQRMTTVRQIEAAQKAQEEAEMSVVLAQPHRLGSRSQNRATALGRFCEDRRLRDELIRAGTHYGSIRAKLRAAIEAPRQDRIGGSGEEVPPEVEAKWRAERWDMEYAIVTRAGANAMSCVEWLAVDDKDLPSASNWGDATKGLEALAIELGMIDPPRGG